MVVEKIEYGKQLDKLEVVPIWYLDENLHVGRTRYMCG